MLRLGYGDRRSSGIRGWLDAGIGVYEKPEKRGGEAHGGGEIQGDGPPEPGGEIGGQDRSDASRHVGTRVHQAGERTGVIGCQVDAAGPPAGRGEGAEPGG